MKLLLDLRHGFFSVYIYLINFMNYEPSMCFYTKKNKQFYFYYEECSSYTKNKDESWGSLVFFVVVVFLYLLPMS